MGVNKTGLPTVCACAHVCILQNLVKYTWSQMKQNSIIPVLTDFITNIVSLIRSKEMAELELIKGIALSELFAFIEKSVFIVQG